MLLPRIAQERIYHAATPERAGARPYQAATPDHAGARPYLIPSQTDGATCESSCIEIPRFAYPLVA